MIRICVLAVLYNLQKRLTRQQAIVYEYGTIYIIQFITHWDQETHICVVDYVDISSDNGLVGTKPLSAQMLKYC